MLRQLQSLGLPIPRLTTRRLTIILVAVSIFAFFLISSLTAAVPSSPSLSGSGERTLTQPRVSASDNTQKPVKAAVKPLPRQSDDTYGASTWFADPNGLSEAFSVEVTRDNQRALLPTLQERQPIYCYYDPLDKTTAGENNTDTELLLIWRRAWWARGFKPLILGPEEAKSNPLYSELATLDLSADLRRDFLRWLAWDTTNGGLLSQYVLFPMGKDVAFLPSLRQGDFQSLTTAADLPSALFWGTKDQIHAGLRAALDSNALQSAETVAEAAGLDAVVSQVVPPVLAYYNATIIAKKYPKIVSEKNRDRYGLLRNQLINSHLQATWLNTYALGIEIVKPFPEHMTGMLLNATDLANALVTCPPTPLAGSCPPNISKCGPCGASTPPVIRTPKTYTNDTGVFTIGMVPHPWTRTVLGNMKDGFNATWIREESERDAWLNTITKGYIGSGVSRYYQLLRFKKALMGESVETGAIWFTAEDGFPTELDWRFGFSIPKALIDDGRSESPVPSAHIHDKDRPDLAYGPHATDEDAERELLLLGRARQVLALPRSTTETRRRASLEAWNMADTEAWKFARAAHDRRTLERKRWEEAARYTEMQRVLSDDGWKPGLNMTTNPRKAATRKSKARD